MTCEIRTVTAAEAGFNCWAIWNDGTRLPARHSNGNFYDGSGILIGFPDRHEEATPESIDEEMRREKTVMIGRF